MTYTKIIQSDYEPKAATKRIEQIARERKRAATYTDTMTAEECLSEFNEVALLYGSHTLNAWDYYMEILERIPPRHRLMVQLQGIYTVRHFRPNEFFPILALNIINEPQDERTRRQSEIRKALHNHIDPRGDITIYRGSNENSPHRSRAISYTIDKDRAQWFATRFNPEYPEVITKRIHYSRILLYTNDREEQEVIIMSDYLKRLIKRIAKI